MARRAKAGIPDSVRRELKWVHALEMSDQATSWGLTLPMVTADAGYGHATAFRQGLDKDQGIDYVVTVTHTTSVQPHDAQPESLETVSGRGSSSKLRYRQSSQSLKQLAVAAGRKQLRQVTSRHGTKTSQQSTTSYHYAQLN